MLDLGVLVFAEPVIEYPYGHVLMVGPGLEGAILQFFLLVLLAYFLNLYSFVA